MKNIAKEIYYDKEYTKVDSNKDNTIWHSTFKLCNIESYISIERGTSVKTIETMKEFLFNETVKYSKIPKK